MTKYRLLLPLACFLVLSSQGRTAEPIPHWVWHSETSTPAEGKDRECRLLRKFRLDQPVRSAMVRLAADFCGAIVRINGRGVLTVEPYSPTSVADAAFALLPGENEISISADHVDGPAAVALTLSIILADGSRQNIVTDDQWTLESGGKNQPTVSMGQAAADLWGIGRRPATIDPQDNYEQWRQALGDKPQDNQASFWVAPGFEIALVRTAAPEEGSWVSMAFDPQGRLTIREDQGLLRMTLDAARKSVATVETINKDLQECRGLLYAHDALYVNANNSKGLYRLKDTSGNGQFDEVRLLRQFPGGVGHGRNDLALGPDGLIYSIHGDSVDLPTSDILDHTSPLREARRGSKTSEGYVIRTDKDGQKFELLAAGLRNPFGTAFNQAGDLFTYDADAEFDMGTPWYRPTRIVQIVPGSDYGWRGVTGKWPPYYADHPDNAPPTLDIGKGSPTAVAFAPDAHFPPDYRRALFVLDWSYGRILAVHLAPRGAGYRAQAETFVKGRPLNVTDLAVGPDGALYIVTGGRKTQSALYRISYTKDDWQAEPAASPHERACEAFSAVQRKLRQELEKSSKPWQHLGSPDPLIRHAARVAAERQPIEETLRRVGQAERRPTRGILTLLVALARTEDQAANTAVVEHLLEYPLAELNVEESLLLLHAWSLALKHAPGAVEKHKQQIISQLDAAFPHPTAVWPHVSKMGTGAGVQRELARLLASLGSPSTVKKVSESLLMSSAQEDRLQALFALRNTQGGWTPESRREFFRVLNEGAQLVSGEGMPKFLAQLREESLATLTDQERLDLTDLVDPKPEPESAAPAPVRPVVKQWSLADFEPLLADAKERGNRDRGATVFRDALCVRCHRQGARGPAVGPDLTHLAGRFSRRDMLLHILEPSQIVAENYRSVQVRTTDGRTLIGRVVLGGDFRSQELRLATDPLNPATAIKLHKSEIDESRESEISPMPRGLLDTFQREEVLDLLAFLEGPPAAP